MRGHRLWRLLVVGLAITLMASACTDDDDDDAAAPTGQEQGGGDEGDDLLQTIKDRGELICGVNEELPGFGVVNEQGDFEGFDIDYCRAVAAGLLGDADAVRYVSVNAEQRFTALQTGEYDVLIRNTTWTATRDGQEGLRFNPTTFYDGQGFMVPADSGISDVSGLQGARICVQSGTTTELNLTSFLDAQGIQFEPVVFEDNTELRPAYEQGQCQAWTSDRSQLTAFKFSIESEGGASQTILEETISKEPLGPAVLDRDPELAEAVDWIVFATFQAEEFGITSENVEGFESDNPEVLRFLGREEGFSSGLPLDADFAVQVISQVGNYAEIYERNLNPIGLEDRGLNALYTDGGLLYPPPYR